MRGVTGAVRKGVQFVSELSLRAILAVVRCGDNLADAKAPTPLQTVLSRVSIRSPRADVLWTAQFCPPPVPPHLHAPHPWRRTRPTPIPVPLSRPGRQVPPGCVVFFDEMRFFGFTTPKSRVNLCCRMWNKNGNNGNNGKNGKNGNTPFFKKEIHYLLL